MTLKNKQVQAVVAMTEPVLSAYCMMDWLIFFRAPLASITPPKHIAQIISHIVFNIPYIPPEESKSFIISLEVLILVSEPLALIMDT